MTKKDTLEGNHPLEPLIHRDSAASIWCSGCGIGIVVNSLAQAVKGDRSRYKVISSGIGCTGQVATDLNFNIDLIVHTNIFEEAIKISRKEPKTKIILLPTDAELMAYSADGLVAAGKAQANILVLYINNYLYRLYQEKDAKVKESGAPKVHLSSEHKSSEECKDIPDTPFLNDIDLQEMTPFNIPLLAQKSGAEYIARWTPLHVRRLEMSIRDAMGTKGLGVIEVTSPCLMYHQNMPNKSPLDRMGQFYENSIIKHNEPTERLDLRDSEIIVGKFAGRDMDE